MNNRRTFLWKLIYSFLLALLGPTLAAKYWGSPVIGPLVPYKISSWTKDTIFYAPYIPLYVTKDLKWNKEKQNYMAEG